MVTFKEQREFEGTVRGLMSNFGLVRILIILTETCQACGFGVEQFLRATAESLDKVASRAEEENDVPKAQEARQYAQSIREVVPAESVISVQENEGSSSSEEQKPSTKDYEDENDETMQMIVDAVANCGAEAIIKALSDACYIAAAVHEELNDWIRRSELLHYAKSLEQMPLH